MSCLPLKLESILGFCALLHPPREAAPALKISRALWRCRGGGEAVGKKEREASSGCMSLLGAVLLSHKLCCG